MSTTIKVGELPFKRDQITELPATARRPISHRFEKHQYAYTNIWIWPDGRVTIITRFVNGKRLDGDHFRCVATLLDSDKNVIGAAGQSAGVNARGVKNKDSSAAVASRCKLPEADVHRIKAVRFEYGFQDKVNDGEFWKAVQLLIEVIVGTGATRNGDFLLPKD